MTSTKLSAITNEVPSPAATDRFYVVEGMGGTPAEGYIEWQDLQLQAASATNLYNGVISVSVASNNLTVAIKTKAGTDPSTSDFVTVRIGASYYQITSALSVTLNAGTNYFGNGDGNAKYYFVYVSYNSGVILGFGQYPYFQSSSDYSNVTTGGNYMARSTGTPDSVENIGMFKATLGTGASYNWSVDSTPVYHGARYTTPEMTWGSSPSAIAVGTGGTQEGYYFISGRYEHFRYSLTLGSSSFSVTASTIEAPTTRNGYTTGSVNTVGTVTFTTAGGLSYIGFLTLSGTTMTIRTITNTDAGKVRLDVINSSLPFTWAVGDKLSMEGKIFLR